MVFEFDASCISYLGDYYEKNEDNFYFNGKSLEKENKGLKGIQFRHSNTENAEVFAVFDGLGGEKDGNIASYTGSRILSQYSEKLCDTVVNPKQFYYDYCQEANDELCRISDEKNYNNKFGTVFASVYLYGDEMYACNLGDSKIFLIREGKMHLLSHDHTDRKLIEKMGINKKPVLLQFLGIPSDEMTIEPFISKGSMKDGDIIIICSDGVSDKLGNEGLYRICRNGVCSEDCARNILAELKKTENTDNSTAIIINIKRG